MSVSRIHATRYSIDPVERRLLLAHNITNTTYGGGARTDRADNAPMINAAIDAAAASTTDKQVLVPAGTFKYTHHIVVKAGVELIGVGDFGVNGTSTSELRSDSSIESNIRLQGASPKLRKLLVTSSYSSTTRLTTDASVLVRTIGASNFYIERVEVKGGASVGIKITDGSNNGSVNSNRVNNGLADGIHTVHGSHHITISNNTVTNRGDDCIAVISYASSTFGQTANINITGNNVSNPNEPDGRGIAVVGGDTILIDNNTISNIPDSGIIVASEAGNYNTRSVTGVTITRNTITNANFASLGGHGGILVTGRTGFLVKDVTIGHATDATKKNTITGNKLGGVIITDNTQNTKVLGNTIDGSTTDGVRVSQANGVQITGNTIKNTGEHGVHFQSGNSGTLTVSNNTIDRPNRDGILLEAVPSISITGNTIKETADHGINVATGCTGAMVINNNIFQNINRTAGGSTRVINVLNGSTFSSLSIQNNSYTEVNGVNYDVEWYIFRPNYTGAGVTVANNTTTTGEPSKHAP